MPRTIDFPRISVKMFRTNGGDIKHPGKRRSNFIQGSISWITTLGAKMRAVYDFGLLEKRGYLCLRYNDPSNLISEIDYVVHLVFNLSNYGHKRWFFLCPKCNRSVRDLYYLDGPYFICKICGKLEPNANIRNYKDLTREANFGSPQKKLRALEKLIQLQRNVARSKPSI